MAAVMLGTGFLFVTAPGAAESEMGKSLYQSKCQMCHGVKGDGNGVAAASLNPKPGDFASAAFWQNMNESKMSETIKNGKGMMPAFNLKPGEIKAVIDYIVHNFKPRS